MAYLIGWQSLPGLIFFCLLLPYFAVLSHVGAKLRHRTALVFDCRISLMNQALAGIRAIKTHTWEDEYRKKIKDARRQASYFSAMLWNNSICSKLKTPIGSIAVMFRRELTQKVPPFILVCYIKVFCSNDVKSYFSGRLMNHKLKEKRSLDTAQFSNGKMKFKINDITQCDNYDEEKLKQKISKRFLDQPHFSFLHLTVSFATAIWSRCATSSLLNGKQRALCNETKQLLRRRQQ